MGEEEEEKGRVWLKNRDDGHLQIIPGDILAKSTWTYFWLWKLLGKKSSHQKWPWNTSRTGFCAHSATVQGTEG